MSDLRWQFNRVVYVRSKNLKIIKHLHNQTENPSEIIQQSGFTDLPRPHKETGRVLQAYYQLLNAEEGVESLHCSSLATWMNLEKFL
jgi:hypothetical protein